MLSQVMNGHPNPTVHSLFEMWKLEDRELSECIDDVRDWMNDVSKLGIPRFGETANRLQQLKDRLKLHFSREDEIGAQLETLYPAGSMELLATRRQSEHDHRLLSQRLEELIERLDELDPPFASWEAAMNEVELFVVALEQHEDQESENVAMLMPPVSSE